MENGFDMAYGKWPMAHWHMFLDYFTVLKTFSMKPLFFSSAKKLVDTSVVGDENGGFADGSGDEFHFDRSKRLLGKETQRHKGTKKHRSPHS
jgi:hypothetical protein